MSESPKIVKPVVSVVIPVYNTDKYLGDAIRSIQNQTFTDWELILVDDCSTDRSGEICEFYSQEDERIHFVALPQNSGALQARNHGIKLAKGKYLCFLDSDDTFEPSKLAVQVGFMQKMNIAVSFTLFQRIKDSGEYMGKGNVPFKTQVSYKQLLGNPLFSIITLMIDTHQVDVPILAEDLTRAEDYVFHLRILKQGFLAYGINEPLSNYRFRPGSQSTSFFGNAADFWKVLTKVEKISFASATFYFGKYLLKGLGKRLILVQQLISSKP